MNNPQIIEEKIKSAMRLACDDALNFSDDESQEIGAEYLLTVNVAKEIATLNKSFGKPYKIFLERKTKVFATDCVPFAKNLEKRRSIKRKSKNVSRNGKIDVTIYRDGEISSSFPIPICAIELKGFNPNRKEVIKDLNRNTEYFFLSCRTGESQIEFTAFASMHSFPKSFDDSDAQKDLLLLEGKYKKWLSEVSNLESLETKMDIFTVRKGLIEESELSGEELYIYQGQTKHHFAGVLVCFRKKFEKLSNN